VARSNTLVRKRRALNDFNRFDAVQTAAPRRLSNLA
jgi:hypothetical protein